MYDNQTIFVSLALIVGLSLDGHIIIYFLT